MDRSLDEIISAKPKTGRRSSRRGGGAGGAARAQVLGKAAPAPAQRARAAATVPSADSKTEKIIVSNLPPDVNEGQIKDFFGQTVGPVKDVLLSYDAAGRSKGVATVNFSKKGDGNKAFQSYNNRLIDGKRPMRIELVVDPSKPLPLASRVTPAGKAAAAPAKAGGPPRRRQRAPRKERPAKSAADLDAEMEDYTSSNAPAAAA